MDLYVLLCVGVAGCCVPRYMAELEEEDRRQRARDATTAQLPDMLDPWDIASRQFDPGANRLWSTDGVWLGGRADWRS